jgi:hypothetical protein
MSPQRFHKLVLGQTHPELFSQQNTLHGQQFVSCNLESQWVICLTAPLYLYKNSVLMAPEKTRTLVIACAVGVVVLAVLGGLTVVGLKIRTKVAQKRQLEELKSEKPVEYYVLHTANTQSEDELKNRMVGTWEMRGLMNRQTGEFIFLSDHSGYFKSWTLTNWSIVTYDFFSNVQYTASGHYTLKGDIYTESIEEATGMMTRYLGAHPQFKIRVDGDKYYQMTAKPPKNANPLEEMWQRVEQ